MRRSGRFLAKFGFGEVQLVPAAWTRNVRSKSPQQRWPDLLTETTRFVKPRSVPAPCRCPQPLLVAGQTREGHALCPWDGPGTGSITLLRQSTVRRMTRTGCGGAATLRAPTPRSEAKASACRGLELSLWSKCPVTPRWPRRAVRWALLQTALAARGVRAGKAEGGCLRWHKTCTDCY